MTLQERITKMVIETLEFNGYLNTAGAIVQADIAEAVRKATVAQARAEYGDNCRVCGMARITQYPESLCGDCFRLCQKKG